MTYDPTAYDPETATESELAWMLRTDRERREAERHPVARAVTGILRIIATVLYLPIWLAGQVIGFAVQLGLLFFVLMLPLLALAAIGYGCQAAADADDTPTTVGGYIGDTHDGTELYSDPGTVEISATSVVAPTSSSTPPASPAEAVPASPRFTG